MQMTPTDDIAYVGSLLDAYHYSASHFRMHVASEHPGDAGVPPDMQAGPVDEEGWVEWRVLPSTLQESDVVAVEAEFGVRFPPVFRAYLLARFHLFDQVRSRRHDQLIFMTDVPSGRRLRKLRDEIRTWNPLLAAGFVPFAEWGDGWGPMCFDSSRRAADGDCPVVWIDRERLIPLGQTMGEREAVLPWVRPLYDSCREFLADVFAPVEPPSATDGDA